MSPRVDPLHGMALKTLLQELLDRHGWEGLAKRVPVRCFQHDPSLSSSLTFLRKTPWARAKVEALYLEGRSSGEADARRKRKRNQRRAARRAFFESIPVERPETLAFIWRADAPPEGVLPPGITIRNGVEREGFSAVQRAIGFEVTEAIWQGIDPVEGTFVLARRGERPVAVAWSEHRPDGWVELGWVAVDPTERGLGLGRLVSSEVVAALLLAGHTKIVGSTQDDRIQALRIYLGMGFRPVRRAEKTERWAAVLAQIEG